MSKKDLGKTSIGIDAQLAGLFCYLAGFVSGIIMFVCEKENRFVRFHALQSIIVFVFLFILQFFFHFLPGFKLGLGFLTGLLSIMLWVVLMIKAYQGELFKVPIAGDIAEKHV